MYRARIPITLTILLLSSCCCLGSGLYLGALFGLEILSPWICFSPTPTGPAVINALRYGPGDGITGVGDDGLSYRVQRVECSHQVGVGTPKMRMQLQVYSETTLLTQGWLYVGLIDDSQVVIFKYVPGEVVAANVQAKYPAVHTFLERYMRNE